MVVFVTGATGFVGRFFLKELLKHLRDNDVVRVLVRRSYTPNDPRVHPVAGDLLHASCWLPAISGADWVFHLAADAAFGNGPHYATINVEPVRQMLTTLNGSKNLCRFVFVSTIGAVDRLPHDTLLAPLTVLSQPWPTSDYGASKLHAEALVRESALPYTIVRPGWVYGDGMRDGSHLKALATAVARFTWLAYLDFPGHVPLIHVSDLACALVRCIEETGTVNKTYLAVAENRRVGDITRIYHETLRGPLRYRLPLTLITTAVRYLHRWLPLPLNVLFSDYLAASDPGFRATLLSANPVLADTGCRAVAASVSDTERWWIVTGANSGIGLALTKALLTRGCRVVAVDRYVSALNETDWLRVLCVNLGEPQGIERVAREVQKLPVAGLVNNAGVGFKAELSHARADDLEATVAVNILAPVRLTYRLLPLLRKSQATIVNITSSTAYHPLPGMATYAASKAFLLNWSLALSEELRDTNTVVTFSPSGTNTGFQSSSGVRINGRTHLFDPTEVAREILRAVDRRRRHTLLGWKSIVLVSISRFLPLGIRLRLWRILFEKMR